METLFQIIAILLSYLIGAVPFGLFFSRLFSDVDVRSVGAAISALPTSCGPLGKKPRF